MGVLNLRKETYHQQRITSALRRRGMLPDMKEEWEIHGPHHPELPYQLYVGYAISQEDPSDCPLVAIYPKAVYEIEDRTNWGRVTPERRIECKN